MQAPKRLKRFGTLAPDAFKNFDQNSIVSWNTQRQKTLHASQ